MTTAEVMIERERWLRENFGGYDPLLAHLTAEFSIPFAVEHTGGGCHAIIAHRPDGLEVHLIMAVDILSSYAEHAALEAEDESGGWAAFVYGPQDDYSESLGSAADDRMSINDFPGVTRLVREAFSQVPASPGASD